MDKVLHICYLDSGGAGRATIRLHKALTKLGVDSKVLVLYKNTNEDNVFKYHEEQNLLRKLLLKLNLISSVKSKNQKILSKYEKTFFIYTFPTSDYRLDKHELVAWADVIHLHWVSGFVDYMSFFKSITKPIVWTIHDKNPLLGGFHLLIDKEKNNKNSITKLEEEHQEYKYKAYHGSTNIKVVAPSKFLANYSSNSRLLGDFKHYQIFNSIDLDLFYPKNKAELRLKYNVANNACVFLFMSEGIEHIHKGLHQLASALKQLNNKDFILLTVGNGALEGINNVMPFGRVDNDDILCDLYSMSDAVIIPSLEDNLPNVMLEAIACGTPVIGTPIGGMKDVVINGYTGIQAKGTGVNDIKEAIEQFCLSKEDFDSNKIREYAINNFSAEKQASSYLKVYNQ